MKWTERYEAGETLGSLLDEYEGLINELRDTIVAMAMYEAISVDSAPEQWAEYIEEETFELLRRAGLDAASIDAALAEMTAQQAQP